MLGAENETSNRHPFEGGFPGLLADGDAGDGPSYILLNDQPIEGKSGDLLHTGDIAEGIARVILVSRAASPFVLIIEADWGMGKSTLLHHIQVQLDHLGDRTVVTRSFNAWTTEGEHAIEELIRTVLGELDPNLCAVGPADC
jgi:predicted KAP-like P-loop ATPase